MLYTGHDTVTDKLLLPDAAIVSASPSTFVYYFGQVVVSSRAKYASPM